MMEHLQQLQNEVLEEEATLLEGAEESQVVGFKCKEVATGDKEGQRPFKKTRGKQPEKYCRDAAAKMGGANPYERCVSAGQDWLYYKLHSACISTTGGPIFTN